MSEEKKERERGGKIMIEGKGRGGIVKEEKGGEGGGGE